jgi:hypothetical protein
VHRANLAHEKAQCQRALELSLRKGRCTSLIHTFTALARAGVKSLGVVRALARAQAARKPCSADQPRLRPLPRLSRAPLCLFPCQPPALRTRSTPQALTMSRQSSGPAGMFFTIDLRPEWHVYRIPDRDIIGFTRRPIEAEVTWPKALSNAFEQVGIQNPIRLRRNRGLTLLLFFCPPACRYKLWGVLKNTLHCSKPLCSNLLVRLLALRRRRKGSQGPTFVRDLMSLTSSSSRPAHTKVPTG